MDEDKVIKNSRDLMSACSKGQAGTVKVILKTGN